MARDAVSVAGNLRALRQRLCFQQLRTGCGGPRVPFQRARRYSDPDRGKACRRNSRCAAAQAAQPRRRTADRGSRLMTARDNYNSLIMSAGATKLATLTKNET